MIGLGMVAAAAAAAAAEQGLRVERVLEHRCLLHVFALTRLEGRKANRVPIAHDVQKPPIIQ
jgi:hypothetical protein